jgi:hypothetical protein
MHGSIGYKFKVQKLKGNQPCKIFYMAFQLGFCFVICCCLSRLLPQHTLRYLDLQKIQPNKATNNLIYNIQWVGQDVGIWDDIVNAFIQV